MPSRRASRCATCGATASRRCASQEKDGDISQDQQRKLQQEIQHLTDEHDQAHRRDPGAKGQGDPAGLMTDPISADGAPRALPRHVAIIMDGNGRWAQARGLPRIAGHRRGAEAVRRTVAGAARTRHPLSDPVRVLVGELEAAVERDPRSDGAAAPLSARRDRRVAPQRRAPQGDRQIAPPRPRHRHPDRATPRR